jgi:2-polyprenyl-6-methoxyphenol hydroxylase-like FAD-dependent oxidoreductase
MIETPVLIVGGGPVGISLAIDLAWRGIDCTLLEEGDGSVDHPRLGIILTRTMEFCRRWGIVDRVYNCGFNPDYKLDIVYCTDMSGFTLARDDYPSSRDLVAEPQSPEKKQRCPQIWFNPLLEKAALEYEQVNIKHFHRFDHFEQDSNGVVAHATDLKSGESVQIRAKYVVACDGAGSTARRQLGIPMEGNPAHPLTGTVEVARQGHSRTLLVRWPARYLGQPDCC